MFEKFLTARVTNRENSSIPRLIAAARELLGKHALHDVSKHFPSYLRFFGTFFELLIFQSLCRASRLLPRCCWRFATVQADVADL